MNLLNLQQKLTQNKLLSQSQLHALCQSSISLFCQQPNILQLTNEQYIIGDIHGQFYDLLNMINNIVPKMGEKCYVFLGDYVDRGYNSVETICMLFVWKCMYPGRVVLIRGNHETSSLTKIYGFYDEVVKKYGNSQPWNDIVEVFQYLPLAAIVQDKIMCVHGGLSPTLPLLDNIACIGRVQEIPESGSLGDLVWSDPDCNISAWAVSNRGAGYLFPHQAAKQFLYLNDLKTIARAHQLVQQGHHYNFGDESVVTVWSAPNYCYRCGNKASVMKVSAQGNLQFISFVASQQNIRHNINYEYVLPYFL